MRILSRKIWRAFPEFDQFDDETCKRYMRQVTSSGNMWFIALLTFLSVLVAFSIWSLGIQWIKAYFFGLPDASPSTFSSDMSEVFITVSFSGQESLTNQSHPLILFEIECGGKILRSIISSCSFEVQIRLIQAVSPRSARSHRALQLFFGTGSTPIAFARSSKNTLRLRLQAISIRHTSNAFFSRPR